MTQLRGTIRYGAALDDLGFFTTDKAQVDNTVKLEWAPVPNASGYEIYTTTDLEVWGRHVRKYQRQQKALARRKRQARARTGRS